MTTTRTAESFTADNGQRFMTEQRNLGFADNDGRWILSLLPETYWSAGLLKMRRAGRFVGAFDTREAALTEANAVPVAAELPPLDQFIR